jgi:ribose-phosphate pyrophosphokinase
MYQLQLIAGSANPELSQEVSRLLGAHLTPIHLTRFADGEIFVQIQENVRGADVFVLQVTIIFFHA